MSHAVAKPSFAWMARSLPRVLALGFGSGLLRPAPGTWGTLAGWAIWLVLLARLPDFAVALVLLFAFVLGCWLCGHVGKELGVVDHGSIVWDELVAIWLVLWLSPDSWAGQLIAVLLFRLFDIIKPPPIGFFDQRLRNGFGVMWDDILAAGYSLLVMALLVKLTSLQGAVHI